MGERPTLPGERMVHYRHTIAPTLACLILAGATLTGCSGSGSGGSGSGSNALHTGSLMFINAQFALYGGAVWRDMNNDGLLDILGLDFDSGSSSGVLMLASGTVGEIVGEYRAIAPCGLSSIVDFDSDGLLDVLCLELESLSPSVWRAKVVRQNPDGTFEAPAPIPGTESIDAEAVATSDVNADDFLDLILLTRLTDWRLLIFAGNAEGEFEQIGDTDLVSASATIDFLAQDLNADGFDDLIGSDQGNYPTYPTYARLGLGDGTFGDARILPLTVWGLDTPVDVNGDGHLDLVSVPRDPDNKSDRLTVYLGDATASYSNSVDSLFEVPGVLIQSVTSGEDINEDGFADVILIGTRSDSRGQPSRQAYAVLSRGDGSFHSAQELPYVHHTDAVDADRDGSLDLLGRPESYPLTRAAWGDGDGTFREEAPETLITAADPRLLFDAAPDIDGDGHEDVYARNNGTGDYTVLYGNGFGGFEPGASPTAAYHAGEKIDLDDDGDLDYYLFDELTGLLTIHRTYNRDDIRMLPHIPICLPGDWRLEYVDVDGDGEEDLFLHGISQTFALFGLGDLRFEPLVPLALRTFPGSLSDYSLPRFRDINGDGRPDYVWFDLGDDQFVVQLAEGTRSFGAEILSPKVLYNTSAFPISPDNFGDLNGDGRIDSALLLTFLSNGSTTGGHLLVFLANEVGMLNVAHEIAVGSAISEARLRDIDGDDDVDILVFDTPGYGAEAYVYLNDGSGNFEQSQHFQAHFDDVTNFFNLHLVDLSGEGLVDIVAVNDTTGISVSLNNGDGTFRGPYHFAVNSRTRGSLPQFGDYDEDGDTDIVAATVTQDALFYLENRYVG